MQPYYTHGSSRVMTPERCTKLCELIAESHTIEEAAEAIGVSIRTVQRQRKRDEDFDHEVMLALQKTPEPLPLMQQAARKHWRAAAWLLERQNPEEYARKPVNTTSAKKVAAALRFVQEMALEATPEEFHGALYKHIHAAIDEAFRHCFPTMGKWGTPKFLKLPIETPLTDVQAGKVQDANVKILSDLDEQGNLVPPSPVGRVELAERQAEEAARRATAAKLKQWLTTERLVGVSPKTSEATPVACDATAADPLFVTVAEEEAALEEQKRRRELRQSFQGLSRAMEEVEQLPRLFFPAAEVVRPPRERITRLQERRKERAVAKKAKAARKRAARSRRAA